VYKIHPEAICSRREYQICCEIPKKLILIANKRAEYRNKKKTSAKTTVEVQNCEIRSWTKRRRLTLKNNESKMFGCCLIGAHCAHIKFHCALANFCRKFFIELLVWLMFFFSLRFLSNTNYIRNLIFASPFFVLSWKYLMIPFRHFVRRKWIRCSSMFFRLCVLWRVMTSSKAMGNMLMMQLRWLLTRIVEKFFQNEFAETTQILATVLRMRCGDLIGFAALGSSPLWNFWIIYLYGNWVRLLDCLIQRVSKRYFV